MSLERLELSLVSCLLQVNIDHLSAKRFIILLILLNELLVGLHLLIKLFSHD